MKLKIQYWLAVICIGLLSGPVHAELKIGVVNFPRLFEEAPQAQAARMALEKKFGPKQREVGDAQKKLKELDEKLTRDSAIMNEAERGRLERDLVAQKRELKRMQEEFGDDLNFERSAALENIQRSVVETVRSLAAEKKFDLVLADGVVFAAETLDITELVLEQLKKETAKPKATKGK
ncbi:MAG: OmpH family outer membrane protein [Gammaproteobacteria bacterium]|nr:OmpH family outer membrane protein [Gammaproteobacteria bacterium]